MSLIEVGVYFKYYRKSYLCHKQQALCVKWIWKVDGNLTGSKILRIRLLFIAFSLWLSLSSGVCQVACFDFLRQTASRFVNRWWQNRDRNSIKFARIAFLERKSYVCLSKASRLIKGSRTTFATSELSFTPKLSRPDQWLSCFDPLFFKTFLKPSHCPHLMALERVPFSFQFQ